MIYVHSYDLIFVIETWLHSGILNSIIDPEGRYFIIRRDRNTEFKYINISSVKIQHRMQRRNLEQVEQNLIVTVRLTAQHQTMRREQPRRGGGVFVLVLKTHTFAQLKLNADKCNPDADTVVLMFYYLTPGFVFSTCTVDHNTTIFFVTVHLTLLYNFNPLSKLNILYFQ